jgi:hypothetical protein
MYPVDEPFAKSIEPQPELTEMNINIAPLRLPRDLQSTHEEFERHLQAQRVMLHVPDSYLSDSATWSGLPEVVCIQRLIALASNSSELTVSWGQNVGREVLRAPSIFPLLAVLVCLEDVAHTGADGTAFDVAPARKEIYESRLQADLFSDIQILLCADNRGHGRPRSLYSSRSGGIIERDEFESIIDLLLSTHKGYGINDSKAIFFIKSVATIVAELFENTEIHGRLGADGKPIPKNGLRGLIFKRVKVLRSGAWRKLSAQLEPSPGPGGAREPHKEIDALEISVFDAGIGFYSAYTHNELVAAVTVSEEWDVVHKCMERHYDKTMADGRPSHRAMGLYEVLRALQQVSGLLEIRSGRIYGFRTFVPGELKFQLEGSESQARPNMPKPVLLDRNRQFVTVPTMHEKLAGSSVRVVIPLL